LTIGIASLLWGEVISTLGSAGPDLSGKTGALEEMGGGAEIAAK
jgi:hypothetical protein